MRPLAERLPDIPRWVEARHLVLTGAFEAFGLKGRDPLAVAIRETGDDGAVFVVGRPSDQAVLSATAGAGGDLIAGPEAADWLADLLPGWTANRARLYRSGDPGRLPMAREGEVRLTDLAAIEREPIDAELLQELREAAARTEIAASFANGRPVAFCYAGWVTETLWDVAIDTVEDFRRQGHAGRVAAFMIRRMAKGGRRPVWCALEENPASWKLAEKLGFVAEDEIMIFERPT